MPWSLTQSYLCALLRTVNKLWNPALTSVSDGFNLLCVCVEEKGMVFLGGRRGKAC